MSKTWQLIGIGLLIGLAGCTGESGTEVTADAKGQKGETSSEEGPAAVTSQFLDALKNGDQKVVEGLMTTRAREEMPKHNLIVQPIGTPDAKFEVGRAEFHEKNDDLAYVSTVWKEPNETGALESFEVVWVMRKEAAGWRIAGMAMEGFDQQAVLFNFEDPVDMIRQRDAMEHQYAQQNEEGAASDNTADASQGETVRR